MNLISRKWWLVIVPICIFGSGWACGGGNGNSSESSLTAPSNLQAMVISSIQINLTWTDNSDNEDGFKIERRTGTGGIYDVVSTPSANITSWDDSGLIQGTTYYYRIRAYISDKDSEYSDEVSATTSNTSAIIPVIPAAP
ncbi:MAG: fibronectin type III domain-containing protein, partial [Candidatus Pacebacteria bacterium]|nr:fibronectin type III domain-containing protein [Candidatus Paceibacterota bacterium]